MVIQRMVLLEIKQVNLLLVLMMVLNILPLGELTWNTSQYLNIWVCDISGGILGYAQFPGGNTALMGLFVIISILVILVLPGPI